MPSLPPRGLYAITDGPRPDLLIVADAALRGGARVLQYRDKAPDHARREREARALLTLCASYSVPLIVNDDIALAAAVGADGVHLGEDDADPGAARRVLGADAIVGVSCYDSLERAHALAGAADYLAFGACFPTASKATDRRAAPALLRAAAQLGRPRVAIGGITPDNAPALLATGVEFVAAISGVFGTPDVAAAAARYASLFPSPTESP